MKNQHHAFINYASLTLLFVFMDCSTSGVAQSIKDQFLNAHNVERQSLGIPLLVWSDTLANYAKLTTNMQ